MFSRYKARGVKLVGSDPQLRIPNLKEPFSTVSCGWLYMSREGQYFLEKTI